MKKIFDISGMTCAACSAHVEKSVRKLADVHSVAVNLLRGSMTVTGAQTLTAESVIQAVATAPQRKAAPPTERKKSRRTAKRRAAIAWRGCGQAWPFWRYLCM